MAVKIQRGLFLLLAVLALWRVGGSAETAVPADGWAELPAEEPKYVALTFDDGPRSNTTGLLLDGLLVRGASATFFLVGQQIPGNEDLVLRMRDEEHQVGNHSWSHCLLQEKSDAALLGEIQKTEDLLREILGDGSYWTRPPYGLLSERQKKLFSTPLVHWSVDPEDWKLRDTEKDVEAVLSRVRPGDIILMHDSVPQSVDAALRIVDELQAQGYVFVTVEELLRLNDVTPQSGVFYLSSREWH